MKLTVWILLSMAVVAVYSENSAQKKPAAWKERDAVVYKGKGKISGESKNGKDYALEKKAGDANVKLQDSGKTLDANKGNGKATATGAGGKQASANKVGSGGTGQNKDNRASYRTEKKEGDKNAYLDANAKAKLTVSNQDNKDKYQAQGNKHQWEADPSVATKAEGKGVLNKDGKKYDYTYTNDSKVSKTSLQDNSTKVFFKPKTVSCQGESVGVSTCKNALNQPVGTVRANPAGDVVVTNNVGFPIAKAKTVKDSQGRTTALVGDGLFNATSKDPKSYDCPGFKNDKVKIKKPLKFKYENERTADGGVDWDFPSCVDLEADLTLGPGVEGKNLVFNWTCFILPAGRLNCRNQASNLCVSDNACVFCNFCDTTKTKSFDLTANAETNLCEAKGGSTVRAKATVCPPPEAKTFYYCDGFSKPLGDPYWKKKGDIQCILEVSDMKTNEEFDAAYKDLKQKTAIDAEWRKATKNLLVLAPNKETVKSWWKLAKAEKVGCLESIVNYSLSGQKVSTSILFEAASAGNILAKPAPCPGQG